jgi:hypothetical protein
MHMLTIPEPPFSAAALLSYQAKDKSELSFKKDQIVRSSPSSCFPRSGAVVSFATVVVFLRRLTGGERNYKNNR